MTVLIRRTLPPLLALAGDGLQARAAERLATIPPAFQGVWMAEQRHCRTAASDESWLRIEAGRISFHESSGPVLAVVRRGSGELAGITDLAGVLTVLQAGGDPCPPLLCPLLPELEPQHQRITVSAAQHEHFPRGRERGSTC